MNIDLEAQLQEMSRKLDYPPTPDLVSAVLARRSQKRNYILLVRAAILLALLLILSAVTVPSAWAAVWKVLGIAEIVPAEQAPSNPPPLDSVLDIPHQISLEEVQEQVSLRLKLPTYPSDIDEPDYVFLSNPDQPIITLVWLEGDQVYMSLHIYQHGNYFRKYTDENAFLTRVKDAYAFWLTEPHLYAEFYSNFEEGSTAALTRQIEMNVLLWDEGGVTYRLETHLSLEEALKIAESLEQPANSGNFVALEGVDHAKAKH